ncbi:hypothetical protein [Pseudolactococcus insecticola]|uniref:Uncharacterized protein n=1 Tax=Pseudolactococcus insecticola TaxID=2709158 RepID=A0A6A0B7C8_9LACT|nr:hypothetical protein [Lactococcus insecticola]GFH40224.1 hypothetical protein Hs20B_06220 [Lactococcus insecticola]
MALTNLISQGTISASSNINGADAVYYSANVSTDGNFNISVTGQIANAIFDADKKVSTEVKSDLTKFITETYKQAQAKRASYVPQTTDEISG